MADFIDELMALDPSKTIDAFHKAQVTLTSTKQTH